MLVITGGRKNRVYDGLGMIRGNAAITKTRIPPPALPLAQVQRGEI
jgi:hypothetical protein